MLQLSEENLIFFKKENTEAQRKKLGDDSGNQSHFTTVDWYPSPC